jgi:hypothetical protein
MDADASLTINDVQVAGIDGSCKLKVGVKSGSFDGIDILRPRASHHL